MLQHRQRRGTCYLEGNPLSADMRNGTEEQNGKARVWLLLLFHWKQRVLVQPKITFQTNVCAEAGRVTEDAASHMCREITVKSAWQNTKKCVCVFRCGCRVNALSICLFLQLWLDSLCIKEVWPLSSKSCLTLSQERIFLVFNAVCGSRLWDKQSECNREHTCEFLRKYQFSH